MRKFGLHLRMYRPGWQRFRPRWRELDWCQLIFDFFGEVPEGCGAEGLMLPIPIAPASPSDPSLPDLSVDPFLPVGPLSPFGCPETLRFRSWIGQDLLAVSQLRSAGIVIPPPGEVAFSGTQDSLILIRTRSQGQVDMKQCILAFTTSGYQAAADSWNVLGQAQLALRGFT